MDETCWWKKPGPPSTTKSTTKTSRQVRRFLEAMKQEAEKCQLSEAELRGFVAEAEIDASGTLIPGEGWSDWRSEMWMLVKVNRSTLQKQGQKQNKGPKFDGSRYIYI